MSSQTLRGVWALVCASLLLSACGRLPEYVHTAAKRVALHIDNSAQSIVNAEESYKALQGGKEWGFLRPYAEEENWAQRLADARATLAGMVNRYDTQVVPALRRNDPADASSVSRILQALVKESKSAVSSAQYPTDRALELLRLRDTAPSIYSSTKTAVAQVQDIRDALRERLDDLKATYPKQAEDLSAKDAVIAKHLDSVRAHEATLDAQMQAIRGNDQADYAAFGAAADGITETLAAAEQYQEETLKSVSELEQTIIRVLADQKIDHYVVVGRASWCEWEDCYGEDTFKYSASKVTSEVYEYMDQQRGTIAVWKDGWGGPTINVQVSRSMWSALRVDPDKRMNRLHDMAEFWVEDVQAKAFHRYTEIVDGQESLTEWRPVSEETFWKHQEHLGLALVSKPVGLYVDEALTTPEPVGATLVAEPEMVNGEPTGRNEYGYWGNGGVWVWYGQYRLISDLLGGSRYGYDDWSSYSRRDRSSPWYGRNEQYGTYGGATYSSNRYGQSSYAKRNPREIASARSPAARTSSRGRPDSSIRGAGAASRGRGPGGSGK